MLTGRPNCSLHCMSQGFKLTHLLMQESRQSPASSSLEESQVILWPPQAPYRVIAGQSQRKLRRKTPESSRMQLPGESPGGFKTLDWPKEQVTFLSLKHLVT